MPVTQMRQEVARPSRALPGASEPRRALVWDSNNSSSLEVGRAFARLGWAVDWLGFANSAWRNSKVWSSRTVVDGFADPLLERTLATHPADALLLHGDAQVRWMLARWSRLHPRLLQHLPPAKSLEVALSKLASADLARRLGVPVLDTTVCGSRAEVAAAGARYAGGQIVIKGEGSAAGAGVVALMAGHEPTAAQWHAVTAHAPTVMLQRRIRGARVLVTVAYEHGVERAACAIEKLATYPADFGPAAFGITRHVDIVHEYAARLFGALEWHGIADIEFRCDLETGDWYFMEINPRVVATLGIEARAGMDLVGAWARVCSGRGDDEPPQRNYRDGVRYAWGTRALARAMRYPWTTRPWQWNCLLGSACDWSGVEGRIRYRTLLEALWMARHE